MALTIDAERSPRLIFVDSATNDITVQELIDELRDWEDDPGRGMSYPRMILAAGKEPLGGGVTVGITATLQNARLAFSPDPTTTSTGTATSASANGQTLVDTAATFQTDGVTVGANVTNATTGAFGTVLSIDSEQQLTLRTLNGGTRQDFQIGDSYFVNNVVQKSVSGGNLVAVDANGAELESIYPTAYTQVVRSSSSAATLQELEDIRFSSFADGSVWIDPASSFTGTDYPTGTTRAPVNNAADAQLIANERGLYNLTFRGNTTVTSTHSGMKFWGRSPRTTQITIDATASLTGCEFQLCLLSGDLGSNGSSYMITVALKNVTGIFGHLENCVLREGTNTLSTPNGFAMLNKCSAVSAVNPGTDIPIFDLAGSGRVASRSLDGEIIFQNKSSGADCSLDLDGAVVTLDSTITAGTWRFSGMGRVVDNSVGATVDVSDLVTPEYMADAVWDEVVSKNAHNGAQSAGRQLRQAGTLIAADGQVDDLAATATSFVTTLTSTTDDFYNDQTIVFTGGALEGQSRIITGYNGTTKQITVEEAFSFAPADTDDFDITAQHVHPVGQIADTVWDEALAGHATAGSAGLAVSDTRDDTRLLEKIMTNDATLIDNGDGSRTIRIYDDDDVTILKEWTISADRLQRTEVI